MTTGFTPVAEFDQVAKKFRRGEIHDSLRDLIPALARRLVRGAPPAEALAAAEFWAVRDVSFRVEPGQALGIIGANGAGKSTVLKLLTRILRPTSGQVRVVGRIGSLIEIAAGFHPDLTGRENLFLQGAIRGMGRREIARRLDAIVAMAELEPFIDTPVKRYSSGMNARLGFSIAVQLEPDVLIIDEVLSVGDYQFQRKAFDAVRRMIGRGIPVVMVSHQLDRIATLCTHAMLLDRGRTAFAGSPGECVRRYLTGSSRGAETPSDAPMTFGAIHVEPQDPVLSGRWFTARLEGVVRSDLPESLALALTVRSVADGRALFAVGLNREQAPLPARGPFTLEVELQANMGRGLYALSASLWDSHTRRIVASGPETIVQVAEDQGFYGTVNLHARVRVTSPERAAQVS